MSEILKVREDMIKRLNVMVRRIDSVSSFILIGDKQCPPTDIHIVISSVDPSAISKIYSDINFLISEFLSPVSFDYKEADGRIIKKYVFENEINVEASVCGDDNFPPADWWVSYLDQNGAAQSFYGDDSKCAGDPVKELPEEPENVMDDFEDDFEDDFDEPAEPEIIPAPVWEPKPVEEGRMVEENFDDFTIDEEMSQEESQPEPQPELNADELWEHIYSRVNLAKRAVAGGSMIHASEIVNELRTELIKLICQNSGINENYIHSIDLLSNEYQKELAKTYPARLESGPMISALAAELSLFEQLIK